MNELILSTTANEEFCQARSDLFVIYQAGVDEHWAVTYSGADRHYVLSNSQFQTLIALETKDEVSLRSMSTKMQAYLVKLAKIGIVRLDAKIPASKPTEPSQWDNPVALAQWAFKTFTLAGRWPLATSNTNSALTRPGGCYVCLKREGSLRGCFGSMTPRLKRLADDIVQNTLAAASWDYRFERVDPEEFDQIEISVDVTGAEQPASWLEHWDPKVWGVQLRQGETVLATLLPNLEGVKSSDEQLEIAWQKAAIPSRKQVKVVRFTSERFPPATVLPLQPYQAKLAVKN